MTRKILLLTVLTFAIMFAACGGDNASKDHDPRGVCPAGKSSTSAKGICFPTEWPVTPGGQIDRTDGGFILLEIPTADTATRQRINDAVITGIDKTIRAAKYHNPTWERYLSTQPYRSRGWSRRR